MLKHHHPHPGELLREDVLMTSKVQPSQLSADRTLGGVCQGSW